MKRLTYILTIVILICSCNSSKNKAISDSAGIKKSLNFSMFQSFHKETKGQRFSVVVKNETNVFLTDKSDSTFLKSVIDIKGFPKEYRDSIMVEDFCELLGLDAMKSGYIDKLDVITSEDSEKLYLIYDFKWNKSKNRQLTFTFWWNDKEQKVEKVNYKK